MTPTTVQVSFPRLSAVLSELARTRSREDALADRFTDAAPNMPEIRDEAPSSVQPEAHEPDAGK